MQRLSLLCAGVFLALVGSVSTVRAAEVDHYADSVATELAPYFSRENAVGAPDMVYADNISGGGDIRLDMGQGEEGLGNLTVHYSILNPQVMLRVDLVEADGATVLTSQGGYLPLASTWSVTYDGTTPYRYVVIRNMGTRTFRLDAVESASVVQEGEQDEPMVVSDEEVIDANPLAGSLVRMMDDRNPATDVDTTVYMVDVNHVRHVVPNEAVFRSWGWSFSDVSYMGSGTIQAMPLGRTVYMRPGSLIKTTMNPKVYVVGDHGVLHWVTNEMLAYKLYGGDWNKRVVDVPETLFAQYTRGAENSEIAYAGGVFVRDTDRNVWYIDMEQKRWSVGPNTQKAFGLDDVALASNMSSIDMAQKHPTYQGRLVYGDQLRWPF